MASDVRWKQRFQNFRRAFALLQEAMEEGPDRLSDLEKEGVIQRFEFSFELAWKCMKDFLEAGGLTLSPVTPKQVLKEAFAAKIIEDGHVWIEMLDQRNRASHTYDEVILNEIVTKIGAHYLTPMAALQEFLLKQEIQ
jgi:nucleotidyltransferase substrate binding protein (TIGR01987 family)